MKTWPVLVMVLVAGTAHAERDRLDLVSEGAAKSNAGDHGAAIALYEQAYLADPDPVLLPILGGEYRRAGLPLDAIASFCQYLKQQPKGAQAAFATNQVLQIRAELGQPVSKHGVCEPPKPVRIDTVTPRPTRAPKPAMSKRELAGIASAAVGLASLGAGLYYGSEARAISNQITSHDPTTVWPDNIQALEERGQRYESREKLFLIAGGAALVTGGILYFTGRADRMDSERLIVAPTVSPSGAGISFARGF